MKGVPPLPKAFSGHDRIGQIINGSGKVAMTSIKFSENCRGEPMGRPKMSRNIPKLLRYYARYIAVMSSAHKGRGGVRVV